MKNNILKMEKDTKQYVYLIKIIILHEMHSFKIQ
jgi:hypothetical protein